MDGTLALEKEFEHIVTIIKRNVEYDFWKDRPEYRRWLENWVFLIADCLIAARGSVSINGHDMPREVVKSRMLKLNIYHFDQVKKNLATIEHPIRNMKKYIFSALYNALATLDDEL